MHQTYESATSERNNHALGEHNEFVGISEISPYEAEQVGGGFVVATAAGATALVLGGSAGGSGVLGGLLAAGTVASAIGSLVKGCGRWKRRRGRC